MLQGDAAKKSNPFRKATPAVFVCGEPQEESLARIDYLHHHGPGWCLLSGPRGIGKTMLLTELARRARSRGESCELLNLGGDDVNDWLTLVADAWRIPQEPASTPTELRRRLEEHLIGFAAMNRPVWILADQAESWSPELVRGCRWLMAAAARHQLTLTVVIAGRDETEHGPARHEADLCLELWPWLEADCDRYVSQCLKRTGTTLAVSHDAISALHDRTSGVPGRLAKLCEWTWLAAQAESMEHIDADLIHAIAEELSPSAPRPSTYELSAAYGAW
jgi:type II secretory pathway predicted ATPase ExeA